MGGLVIRPREPDAALVREWDRLADRARASPFVRPGWVLPWHHAWGAGNRLVLLAAFRENTLVGLLPFQVRGAVVSSPTNWHTPEYAAAAEDDDVARALLAAAVGRNARRLQMGFVTEHIAEYVADCAARTGQRVLTRVLESGPYLDLDGTFADYEATLDRRLRTDLRRRRRRLEEVGEVRVEVHTSFEPDAFAEFLRVEAAGWKGAGGTAVAAEPQTRRFYAAVARDAGQTGRLRLALLRVGGRCVAADVAVQSDGVHYLLKTGFDPQAKRFAPGKLLRLAMLERAFDDRLERYEFLGADAAWKREWTSSVRPQNLVQVFDRTAAGRVDHLAHVYGRPAAKYALTRVRRRPET